MYCLYRQSLLLHTQRFQAWFAVFRPVMQTIHGVGKSTQQVKISAWYIFQVCVRNFWLPLLTSEHKYLNCLLLTFSKQALTTFHQITSLISTYQWTSRTADVARRKMCVVTNIQLHLALQKWLLGILYFWVHFKLYHSLSKESESVLLLLPESLENGKYSSKLINTVNTSYTQRHMWRFWLWSCPVAVWIVSWAELSAPENIKVAIKLSTSKTKQTKKKQRLGSNVPDLRIKMNPSEIDCQLLPRVMNHCFGSL